jgi:hydroxyethylthiazole kinase
MKPPVYDLLERVRQRQPVVHHITNWVTIYDCAQVVKTLGASPVMAHAREEVSDMVQIASALVLNLGTLTVDLVEAMKLAAYYANQRVIPVVLDVCGVGATRLRDTKGLELLDAATIDIIKGNRSEIACLCGERVTTRGVDSTKVEMDLTGLAKRLAQEHQSTVVVTGKEDVITDGKRTYRVKNGHPLMTRVVGTGCMATSVIATFAAVEPDLCAAAVSALCCYEIAAEIAAEKSSGPASFKQGIFDSLYHLDRKTVTKRQKIES